MIFYFGLSPQPSPLYYAHRMHYFIYGIVCTNIGGKLGSQHKNFIYLVDFENAFGSKNANLKLNFLLQYYPGGFFFLLTDTFF